jgi:murein DD-endopeptidase MepM/ murein hydrolase activator NlpD
MFDYIKRLSIAVLIAMSIALLFVGGSVANAEDNTNEGWLWPTQGDLSDAFGTRDGKHYGIDIAAGEGTPVSAVHNGKVIKSYYSSTYGNVIFIRGEDGYETIYAHLNNRLVNEGESVNRGKIIGSVGNTGRSYGAHLHFEVHKGEWNIEKTNAIDPLLLVSNNEKTIEVVKNSNNETDDNLTKNEINYSVLKDDTLWSISKRYNVTIDEIKTWNGLNSDLIKIGQALVLYGRENENTTLNQ